ncbi:MAG: DUF1015 domain-containing protein [Saprospiraceae bacterium]|nr:DUF1015 domain-containing protein [Saprospiraceae bacterium]
MHIQPFQASYPLIDRIDSPDAFCADAKNAFPDYRAKGLLTQTAGTGVFIYQIESHHRLHTGLVALNDVQDFFKGKVKKHEKTLSAREQHQMDLLLRWGAVLKPILLTFPPVPALQAWLDHFTKANPPFLEVSFKKEGQQQRLWMATDPDTIRYLQELFVREVNSVYIADGHHRTSTLALLHQQMQETYPRLDFDHLFCAYFATDQLDILDYNRVVDGLNGLSPEQFFEQLGQVCTIEHVDYPRKPRRKFQMKLYFRGHWYRLEWRSELLTNFKPHAPALPVLLDVSLLNELVLHNILGIREVRTDARIGYVEGTKGLRGIRKQVDKQADRTGFVLHPVSFSDMMAIADAEKILPPKSTYFEPRMKSGLIIKMLER